MFRLLGLECYYKVILHETIRNDDFQRNTALQHCSNIATLCCAKNRRCESSRATSLLRLVCLVSEFIRVSPGRQGGYARAVKCEERHLYLQSSVSLAYVMLFWNSPNGSASYLAWLHLLDFVGVLWTKMRIEYCYNFFNGAAVQLICKIDVFSMWSSFDYYCGVT